MSFYEGPYEGNGMFKSFTKTWHNKPYPAIDPRRPELSASGKVVFITGGGTGIGLSIAIAFAKAGAKTVAIFGRRLEILRSAVEKIKDANPGTNVIFEALDVSNRENVETAFANATKTAGNASIDVLVSNAGFLDTPATLTETSEKSIRESVEINLFGAFNVAQVATPLLAPNASVVNISSGIGHIEPFDGHWAYAAMKLAVVKMFDYLQHERPDFSVFNIQPGVIETSLSYISGHAGQDDIELPGCFLVWITSPEGKFLKGKFVWVNWDVDEMKAQAKEIQESSFMRVNLDGVAM